jgi:hypothetical protein
VLHKHLNFAELAAAGAAQVLCCDLDTVFFGDVARLFDHDTNAHVVAREEVFSSRSAHGADRAFIDEPLLAQTAHALGRATFAPINLGVVLYNHGVVSHLAQVMPTFVDDAWRLMCGLTMPGWPNAHAAGRADQFAWMSDVRRRAGDADLARALPFPSNNGWIVEEIAWWLALGSIPGLTQADFRACDVAQNGEVLSTPPDRAAWVMCHYYSHNLGRVVEWLQQPQAQAASSAASAFRDLRRAAHAPSAAHSR